MRIISKLKKNNRLKESIIEVYTDNYCTIVWEKDVGHKEYLHSDPYYQQKLNSHLYNK